MTETSALVERYLELQRYVGWTADDARRVEELGSIVQPALPALIEDFYDEIQHHPQALKVITGGPAQIARLKQTLLRWLDELFSGDYGTAYVERRWRVGHRHVEIGLSQVYTNMALSRLRSGLVSACHDGGRLAPEQLSLKMVSLHKLLDLDLAIIEDAYQTEYMRRQQLVERLATIGQVAGGVAHELRNPLNVIKTSIYYLLNARQPSAEKTAEHFQRVQKQVDLADGVITALTSFARIPLPAMEPFRVENSLRETVDVTQLPENITVEYSFPETLADGLGDAVQLRIVFSNLIRNARDAMPEGGRLTISAQEDGDSLDVSVTDTGTGIPEEIRDKIMEPLFTTKARGIGLGLAIARAIVEKNNGSLKVQSEPGQGATFIVRLRALIK